MIYYIVHNFRNKDDTDEDAELVAIFTSESDVAHFVGGTFCSVFTNTVALDAALTVDNELSNMVFGR